VSGAWGGGACALALAFCCGAGAAWAGEGSDGGDEGGRGDEDEGARDGGEVDDEGEGERGAGEGEGENDGEPGRDDDDKGKSSKKKKKSLGSLSYDPGDGVELSPAGGKGDDERDGVRLGIGAWVQPALLWTERESPPWELAPALHRARLDLRFRLPLGFGGDLGISFDDADLGLTDALVSWEPIDEIQLVFGRFKAPSGLERGTGARDLPFLERSAVALLQPARSLGFRFRAVLLDGRLRATLALQRGQDSDDFDPDRNVDLFVRVSVAAAKPIALGVHGGLLGRPLGDPGVVPEDPAAGGWFRGRSYVGLATQTGLDACLALPWLRVQVDGALRRDGLTFATESGHLLGLAGHALLGISPLGERDGAEDGGALRRGVEILVRGDGARFQPAPGNGEAAALAGLAWGFAGAPARQILLRAEARLAWTWNPDSEDPQPRRVFTAGFSATVGL
jgi:hypothetical protein